MKVTVLFVDGVRAHLVRRFGGVGLGMVTRETCHLASDRDVAELHDFARDVGIPRSAYHPHAQHPHYDLTAERRVLAVAAGAVEVTSKELVRRCFRRRP